MSTNKKIAEIFYQMSEILEVQGLVWESRAYQKAARTIETFSKDVADIYKQGGLQALMEIPGVGKGLAEKIQQFVINGRIEKHEELLRSIPKGLIDIMSIQGLGPKKASKLYKKLKIDNVEKLEKAAKDKRIRRLEGFGEKSEADILKGVELFKKGQKRMLLGDALPLAMEIINRLKSLKEVERIEVAGSLRRRKETVGDIDILVISKKPTAVMDFFVSMPNVDFVQGKGMTKSSVTLKEGLDCDVRVLDPKSFGAALNYFTGSKEHNIRLRQIAITNGWKLSEYGLFDKKNNLIAGKTEEEVYKKLGMSYIEPEMRENTGEIEASIEGRLPTLIGYSSIKGDLHIHTKWSDGAYTSEEMVKAAIGKGYKYMAITDHSKSERIANGMDEKRLANYVKELDKLQEKYPQIKLLKGSEISIQANGGLDYPLKILKELDLVIGSIHSRFKSTEEEMTNRIIKALDSGMVTILGHPTGRLIHEREPYSVNLEKIFEAAKRNGVALEINASPSRLDLNDFNIRKAVSVRCKFAINTDAHSVDQLGFMGLGVSQARRGWLEEKDVVNCCSWEEFEKVLKK